METDASINRKVTLLDAIKIAWKNGYFKITDESNYGCDGIHCETTGFFKNGFYCFDEDEDYFKYQPEDYVKIKGEDYICKSISDTWESMIEDFPEEIYEYLRDIKQICEREGKTDIIDDVLTDYMNRIEKICDRELNEEKV